MLSTNKTRILPLILFVQKIKPSKIAPKTVAPQEEGLMKIHLQSAKVPTTGPYDRTCYGTLYG